MRKRICLLVLCYKDDKERGKIENVFCRTEGQTYTLSLAYKMLQKEAHGIKCNPPKY